MFENRAKERPYALDIDEMITHLKSIRMDYDGTTDFGSNNDSGKIAKIYALDVVVDYLEKITNEINEKIDLQEKLEETLTSKSQRVNIIRSTDRFEKLRKEAERLIEEFEAL